MKTRFLGRVTAFITALVINLSIISGLPVGSLSGLSVNVEAISSYGNVIDYGDMSTTYGETWWKLNSEGTLYVGGTGRVGYGPLSSVIYQSDYDRSISPWYDDYYGTIIKVVVEEGVTEIANWAFSGLMTLKTVDLPSTLTTIGARAFYNDTRLTTVNISKNTDTIMTDAFGNCSKHKLVYYEATPSQPNKCGDNAFWTLDNNVLTISGTGEMWEYPIGTSGDVLNNNGSPFQNLTFTEIVVDEGITSVGQGAFFQNRNSVSKVTLSKTVLTLGCSAFEGMSIKNVYCYNKDMVFMHAGESILFLPNEITIYGYRGSTAETYAKEYNIPFVVLDDDNSTYSEEDLLNIIKQKSGKDIIGYIYTDMDNDGEKEIIAAVPNNSLKDDIWYCSSDSLNCSSVASVTHCEYCNFYSINYDTESHVIINSGNNSGDGQYSEILALHNKNISVLFNKKGYVTINDDNTIKLTTRYTAPAKLVETNYYYNKLDKQYKESDSEINDNNSDTTSDSRYDKLYLTFDPKNISYTYNAGTKSFNVASTDCEITLSCLDLLQTGLFMDVSKIVVTPPKGFSINGLDERTPHSFPYDIPSPINGGSDGDLIEHFVLYPPTKEFLNGNPLTDSYTTELTITVYGDDGFIKTFTPKISIKYVAQSKETTDVEFINQHFWAAVPAYWNKYHEVADTMAFYDNNLHTEAAHSTIIGIDTAVHVINIEVGDTIKQFSSNAYNAILLDMYYDLEMNDSKLIQYIYEDSLRKSIDEAINPVVTYIRDVCGAEADWSKFSDYKFRDDLQKCIDNDEDLDIWKLLEKNGLVFKSGSITETKLKETPISDILGSTNNILSNINTANKYLENIKGIICAYTLRDMNETYRQLLDEIKTKAQNVEGHSWEKTDLIHALDYEINYRKYYGLHITWESGKTIYTAFSSTKEFKDLKKKLWEAPAEDLIRSTFKNGAAILAKISAVQFGTKVGWSISDEIFHLTESTELYYKGKAYGVLENILIDVLNETSPQLEFCSVSDTVSDIERKHKIAQKFDYAFRMYTFVEANGCETYSKYEKSYLPDEDNWLKSTVYFFGAGIEYAVRSILSLNASTAMDDMTRIMLLRDYNTLYFQRRADFVKNNLKCHGDEFNTADGAISYVQKVSEQYMKMLDKDVKLAAVLCPVEVEVYNENGELVGTISKTQNTIEDTANVFAYRNEALDANIIVCDADYSIKIKGIGEGKMKIFGSYCSNNETRNAVVYANIPINNNFVANFDIDIDNATLIDDGGNIINAKDIQTNSTTQPVTPNDNNYNQDSSSYNGISPNSTTFNVKIENKITGKTNKAKATRTGENVTVDVGKENNGYYANIYTTDGNLLDSVKIKSGKAKFTIQNDIDFYIIIDKDSHLEYEDVSSGAGIYEFLENKKEPLGIFVIIIAALGFLSIIIVKRFSKNKQ